MFHGNCFTADEVNPRICRTLSSIHITGEHIVCNRPAVVVRESAG